MKRRHTINPNIENIPASAEEFEGGGIEEVLVELVLVVLAVVEVVVVELFKVQVNEGQDSESGTIIFEQFFSSQGIWQKISEESL